MSLRYHIPCQLHCSHFNLLSHDHAFILPLSNKSSSLDTYSLDLVSYPSWNSGDPGFPKFIGKIAIKPPIQGQGLQPFLRNPNMPRVSLTRIRMGKRCRMRNLLEILSRPSRESSSKPETSHSSSLSKTIHGPVRMQETARSAAKVRPPVSPGSSTVNAPVRNDTNSNSSNTILQSQQHPAHHFMDGGMPCDPTSPSYSLADYGEESLYTLILLRHGESEWNSQNRYTGWCDVNLTEAGRAEARRAGRLLSDNNIEIDQAFTSVLKRASFSCNMALNAAHQHWVPVTKTWRLNERHYGALQGYNKDTAWQELGLEQELVMQMRRAYDVRPPVMDDEHPFWHGHERRYRKLTTEQLEASRTESLKDAADRILPFFRSVITPSVLSGNKCLIVSHANTIRTLVKHIDNISDEDIKSMTIPTGIPLLYRLDKNMKPVDPHIELEFRYMVEPKGYVGEITAKPHGAQFHLTLLLYCELLCFVSLRCSYTWGTSRAHGFHGVYLGDLERLQDIQRKRDATNRNWQKVILRNIGKSLGWEMEETSTVAAATTLDSASTPQRERKQASNAVETRQVWWQIHTKMKLPDYRNMLLLVRMQACLEDLMYERKQKYVTQCSYESLVKKIHLDTEGCVVEPFVDLANTIHREERQQIWYENLALDMEEECLIR